MRQCGIGDSTSADISVQNFDAAGRKFVGQNGAAVPHAGSDLRGFGARRRCHIHDPLRMIIIGEQGRDRQHRTGLLNVKQAA
ncbi:Uncharacterised protein [Salmonella enterica subsp. enterica]|nr:Uncharacterised protein [Salmonella enterica subsp. enterica]